MYLFSFVLSFVGDSAFWALRYYIYQACSFKGNHVFLYLFLGYFGLSILNRGCSFAVFTDLGARSQLRQRGPFQRVQRAKTHVRKATDQNGIRNSKILNGTNSRKHQKANRTFFS